MQTQTATSKITKLTPVKLQRWARSNHALVQAMLDARKHAQAERARVDAYIEPLFATFGFVDECGAAIATSHSLYHCQDEGAVSKFYAVCDAAHREHGFTGEPGYCPALVADHDAVKAETAVVRSMEQLLGVEVLNMDHRAKLLGIVVDMIKGLSL